MQGAWIRSLIGELRSHSLWGNLAHLLQLESPWSSKTSRVSQLSPDAAKQINIKKKKKPNPPMVVSHNSQ